MKSLAIAFKDIKTLIRDRTALLILIAMPLTIIAILGMSLGSMWKGEASINKFDVAVVDRDKGSVSKVFVDQILGSAEMKKIMTVTRPTEKKARASVANGDLAAVIIIPSGFSDAVNKGESARITVLGDPGQQVRAGIVRSITESFANHASSVMIGVSTPTEILVAAGAIPPSQIGPASQKIAKEAQAEQIKPRITVAEESMSEEKTITAMQYYSVGIGVMFILFGSMFGAFSLLDERHQLTLARMMAAPTGRLTILGGKLGGVFLIGIIQFGVILAATRVMFGVDWGNSISGIIMLTAATVLAATGMAIFIASVTKTEGTAAAMAQIMIQGMAALGGSMIPLATMPPAMQAVSKFTVNYWAVSGFSDLMLGKGMETIFFNCLVLVGIAVLFMTLGVWRFRYE